MAENSKTRIDWKWKFQQLWERTIGMRLAQWLDKRHPDWCWASLCVDLGMGWDIRGAIENAQSAGQQCKSECSGPIEGCWCGKFMSERLKKEIAGAAARRRPGRAEHSEAIL